MSESDIRQILVAIARVESKVEHINAKNVEADQLHRDLNDRISALEQFRWTLAGALAGGTAFGGVSGALLTQLIGG